LSVQGDFEAFQTGRHSNLSDSVVLLAGDEDLIELAQHLQSLIKDSQSD